MNKQEMERRAAAYPALVKALKELVAGVSNIEGCYESYEAYVAAKDVLIEIGEMEPRK